MLKRIAFALSALLTALLVIFAFAVPALANSPIPPTLAVYPEGLPEGAELYLTSADGAETVKAEELSGVWSFYFGTRHEGEPTLRVKAGGSEYSFTVTEDMLLNGAALTFGEDGPVLEARPSHTGLQILTNFGVTIVLELIMLLLFGYRKGRTFLIVLLTNVFTQIAYNFFLYFSPMSTDFLLVLLLGEAAVFIIEGLIYSLTIAVSEKNWSVKREHSRGRAWGYAITANMVSMILGTVIILILSATLFR